MAQEKISRQEQIEASVKAQARVRAILGIPVILLMMASIWQWGTSSPWVGAYEVIAIVLIYIGYNFVVLYFTRRMRPFTSRQIVYATAVLDPLMLSSWLMIMGYGSYLFTCFYLFTILGFGFRVGTKPMWTCQAVSVIGMGCVATFSPLWHAYPLFAISNLLFLVVVPLYATVLIKKLHAARAHAERESEAKSNLLANVSHELRTPLAGIVAAAQLIEEETSQSKIASRADTIVKLSQELTFEINDLLDSAKYEANAITLDKSPFLLPDVMDNVGLALSSMAAAKNIGLSISADPRITQAVVGDAHYLSRVLMNLGNNAIKFTEKGRVDVVLNLIEESEDSYFLRFFVRDTGIGIPSELHEKIFDPFFQASSGTTRKYGGTGLGTSIAKQIVELMGGKLKVESEVGQGSLFYFEVRLAKTLDPKLLAANEQEPMQAVYGKKILIADDNLVNLMLTKEMLEKDRHSVIIAQSGVEALQAMNCSTFDAIFLDYNMADMDGAQVLQLYRFGKLNPAPVFCLTADTTHTTAERLRQFGMAGVLHKPITLGKLRDTLVSLFPGEATTIPAKKLRHGTTADAKQPTARPSIVSVVPLTDCIDRKVIVGLRGLFGEQKSLNEVLATGIIDIRKISGEIDVALDALEVSRARDRAHALKGLCVSIGAIRLSALAGKIMQTTMEELRKTHKQWRRELREVVDCSIDALEKEMIELMTPDR